MSKKFAGFSLNKKPQTAFERDKAEKAEKDRLEQEQLASVLAEFEEEHGEAPPPSRGSAVPASVTVPQGNRRHYAAKERSKKSGPGTLDPVGPFGSFAGSAGPQVSNNQPWGGQGGPPRRSSEDPYRTVIARLSNLPPGMDQQSVKEIFDGFDTLQVVKVEIIPPTRPQQGRPSVAMKVTFDQSTNYRDLEDAINKLNDKKYLGRGYYLHLDRWLGAQTREQPSKLPFGARWVDSESDISVRAQKHFAPPPDMSGLAPRAPPREEKQRLVVTVNRPHDAATLRLIHMTAESVIKGGLEFEAALMQDSRVINDERYAWIWDSKHPLNRYYRWTLHRLVCGEPDGPVELFQGMGEWEGPKEKLAFEFAAHAEDVDPDELDPDEILDEDLGKRHPHLEDMYPGYVDNASGALNPKARMFFMWLLRSLPSNRDVTAIDVAPFSTFAHDHAWHGMDEIIDLLVTNVIRPFCWEQTDAAEKSDAYYQSMKFRMIASLNALRIVSDIVFTTEQAGGKSWKYREGLGKQLVDRKVFEFLDELGEKGCAGILTLTPWREKINYVIETWGSDKTFSAHDHFHEVFNTKKMEEDRQRQLAKQARQRLREQRMKEAHDRGGETNTDQMDIDDDAILDSGDEANEDTHLDPGDTNFDGTQNVPVPAHMTAMMQTRSLTDSEKSTIEKTPKSQRISNQHLVPASTSPSKDPLQSKKSAMPKDDLTSTSGLDIENAGRTTPTPSKDLRTSEDPVAARVRRQRPKAEDLFGSDGE